MISDDEKKFFIVPTTTISFVYFLLSVQEFTLFFNFYFFNPCIQNLLHFRSVFLSFSLFTFLFLFFFVSRFLCAFFSHTSAKIKPCWCWTKTNTGYIFNPNLKNGGINRCSLNNTILLTKTVIFRKNTVPSLTTKYEFWLITAYW